ncbi:hypothetical protein BD410DRAFT_395207 [Rickenella mellea]|uniref:Uncharacterized protein n=1 Tax=Rickenella mellea TaxID=50990 RepID=A0A4Y7PY41_9AGAM|nr:hypothetical protein BD410DRAFT_395207 [Rickenella mellea]
MLSRRETLNLRPLMRQVRLHALRNLLIHYHTFISCVTCEDIARVVCQSLHRVIKSRVTGDGLLYCNEITMACPICQAWFYVPCWALLGVEPVSPNRSNDNESLLPLEEAKCIEGVLKVGRLDDI